MFHFSLKIAKYYNATPTAFLVRKYGSLVNSIRNVAIIAHVDHGKTTLVDSLIKCGSSSELSIERLLDCNEIEKERGITILAKSTYINYKDFKINIVDTPGHADFGGEVERALSLVDGAVLVVDATEGPMSQTKYVLEKAIKRQLKFIVVINKIDRETSRVESVESEILDLFLQLEAKDFQLEYTTLYASAKNRWASKFLPKGDEFLSSPNNMSPLIDEVIRTVPAPSKDSSKPFSMLVNSTERIPFIGKCAFGRIESGSVNVGSLIKGIAHCGVKSFNGQVQKLFAKNGLENVCFEKASAGDLVYMAGLENICMNDTIGDRDISNPLEINKVDPPTLSVIFSSNDSPLASREGKSLTFLTLNEILAEECENNISMSMTPLKDSNGVEVAGRGELQIAILAEKIRRKGYEVALSPPKVIFIKSETGQVLEPVEHVTIDVETKYTGFILESLVKRKGIIKKINETENSTKIEFSCPTRGLIGFSSSLRHETKGTAVMNRSLESYMEFSGQIDRQRKGAMMSMVDGQCTSHALGELENRGHFFVKPGIPVYIGMVIGEAVKNEDLDVNPCRQKAISGVRTVLKEENVKLTQAIEMTIEEFIAYMDPDEVLEITPKSLRLRKAILSPSERRSAKKKALY